MVGLQAFSEHLFPGNLFQLSLFLSCPGLTFCPLGNRVKEQVSLPGAAPKCREGTQQTVLDHLLVPELVGM